jgi:hypothetical protein
MLPATRPKRPSHLGTRVFSGDLQSKRGKHVLLAMQKVEGSKPFSRFGKGLHLSAVWPGWLSLCRS